MSKISPKVICAMSGGVDSSTAAALLKKQGFKVIGIFMHFWKERSSFEDNYHQIANKCCSLEAQRAAFRVAKKLGIPFNIFRFEKEFKKYVVDYFIKEYSQGYTPNPCVMCNRWIKFNFLLDRALSLGAKYVATGHYVKIKKQEVKGKTIYRLYRAKDKTKDQSYFLWTLTQKQLRHLLFPIGDYTKKQVRNLAHKFGLATAYARESQGICFILEKDVSGFLKGYLKLKPGPIKTQDGKVIGQHKGLPLYTIGQRKGIGLAGGPFYVVKLDFKNNTLIVSKNEKDLYAQDLLVKDVNWISGIKPNLPFKIQVQIRYRQKPASAVISQQLTANHYQLIFKKPQRAVTLGQSAVFYKGDEILGGGVIEKIKN